MENKIMNKMGGGLARMGLQLKKHSPEILTAVGIVGVLASTVLACKATTKLSRIIGEAKETTETIRQTRDAASHDGKTLIDYSAEDAKKDIVIVYVQTGIKLVKLYAPAALVLTVSLASLLGATGILRKRSVALTAAYSAIDNGFKSYKKRVADRFGEDVERELRYGVTSKTIEDTFTDENGEEQIIKETVTVSHPEHSPYARMFDENSLYWEPDPPYALMFLKAQQQFANDRLRANGHLFLNEVYDDLGLKRTKEGQIVGWVYNSEIGDNYVDFGIYEGMADFEGEGTTPSTWLDFNVDGVVYDLI